MPPDIPQNPPVNSPYQPLTLDFGKYRQRLDAFDLTDAQKDEYLHALWLMVVSFADLNMPELFTKPCGQARIKADAVPDATATVLYSSHSETTKGFAKAANVTLSPKSKKEAS